MGGSGEPGAAHGRNGHETDTAALLATRLMVPVPRWRPVARQRLLGLLDEGAQGPLTLLAAPAGYGKTLLLTAWATGAGTAGPGGLGAGRPGRPPSAAVLGPGAGRAATGPGSSGPDGLLAGLDPQAEIGDGFMRALVGGLSELDGPVVLILDDLHEATGQAVVGQLRFLLRHAPAQLRLVVATRADPPLALHRLRVAGQLSEIREAELAFSWRRPGGCWPTTGWSCPRRAGDAAPADRGLGGRAAAGRAVAAAAIPSRGGSWPTWPATTGPSPATWSRRCWRPSPPSCGRSCCGRRWPSASAATWPTR